MKKIRIVPEEETTYRIRVNTNPISDIAVFPDDLETITPAWLIRWGEWVAAGRPDVDTQQTANTLYILRSNDWNPALHPRDPNTGKFVERSFNVPDDAPDFDSLGVRGTLEYLSEQGEPVDEILDPDSGVTIDGVPNDAKSIADISSDGTIRDAEERARREELISETIAANADLPEENADTTDTLINHYSQWTSHLDPEIGERFAESVTSIQHSNPTAERVNGDETALSGGVGFSSYSINAHETGHSIGHIYGLSQGEYTPDDVKKGRLDWDAENKRIEELHALRSRVDGLFDKNEVPGLEEYVDAVESEHTRLTRDDFDSADGGELYEASAGDMLRFEAPLPDSERFGDRNPPEKNYHIEQIDSGSGEEVPKQLTLSDYAGNEYRIIARPNGEYEPRDERTQLPNIIGTREGTPDEWGLTEKDPDEYLGTTDLDGEEAVQEFFRKANKAWYRQAVATREGGDVVGLETSIGDDMYSVENAGETIARTFETLTGDSSATPATIKSLVNHHPDFLEATRNVVDELPTETVEQINDELESARAEYRFPT